MTESLLAHVPLAAGSPDLKRAQALITTTPDFPEPGVQFRDISPMLADPEALRVVFDGLAAPFAGQFDLVAGIEARGFLIAGGLAAAAGTGMLAVRKAGKLPNPDVRVEYDLEYGSAVMEASGDLRGRQVLLVDDVLATGGTMRAAYDVIAELGGELVGSAVILELDGLGGRGRVPDCRTLFRM
ncbi:adenine phosphoribosyltransferase [Brevibacterium daeguense]|uniref:Adenine phosphoribosyltransferase n=1 Tax=Brevibacterium daeguense TaxID=909936 RepID=A0ABP8EKS3_9MICO